MRQNSREFNQRNGPLPIDLKINMVLLQDAAQMSFYSHFIKSEKTDTKRPVNQGQPPRMHQCVHVLNARQLPVGSKPSWASVLISNWDKFPFWASVIFKSDFGTVLSGLSGLIDLICTVNIFFNNNTLSLVSETTDNMHHPQEKFYDKSVSLWLCKLKTSSEVLQ